MFGKNSSKSLQAQREREMDTAADEKEVGEAAKNIQRVYVSVCLDGILSITVIEDTWREKLLER